MILDVSNAMIFNARFWKSDIEFNIDTENRRWFARQINKISKDSRMKRMIAILNVDENLNNLSDRYWDHRWDQKVWSIDKKDKYVLKMFSKKINDFDIETTWILKVSKLEMILTFWLNIESIIEVKKWHWIDKSMSMFSSWLSSKKNSFDVNVLTKCWIEICEFLDSIFWSISKLFYWILKLSSR